MSKKVSVYLEVAPKRTLASAIDWPGWARGGRTEEAALEAFVAYGTRYAKVARRAKLSLDLPSDPSRLDIAERLKGSGTTEFGVPSLPASTDEEPHGRKELDRLEALLQATWAEFDAEARAAAGIELRKGPRGGGRDLDKIVDHVVRAEASYLHQLGAKHPLPDDADAAAAWPGLREAILPAVRARAQDEPIAEPTRVRNPWSPFYFIRRAAWHVLDHAWEIEDRADPGG